MTITLVHDERNGIIDPKVLGWRPNSKVTLWNMYFVNGYKFHTNTWTNGKRKQQ